MSATASRGLFLDLDGTLADSLGALRTTYRRFLGEHGARGSDEEFDRLNGVSLETVVSQLRERHRLPADEAKLYARYRELVGEAHADAAPTPGARALLEAARAAQVPIAIVTSGPVALAQRWLIARDLAGFVHTVAGGDEASHAKPDPELYRLALTRTGCRAEHSMAVEDSRLGAEAALAAGLPTWVLCPDAPHPADWPPIRGFIARLDELVSSL